MSALDVRADGPVAFVGIDRPASRNALDEATVGELHGVLDRYRDTPSVLVIHSCLPGVFVSGADIGELVERDADDALRAINAGLFDRLEAHRWPTIAAVDGWALGGGCELALACDLRIATPSAIFGQPELGLGILAGAGANSRLPATAGLPVARRMLYLGARLSADEALGCGLVDAVVSADVLLERAREMARRIASASWRALELTKLALRLQRSSTTSFDLVAQAVCFESDDKRDRMRAFLDRRS
ncbi:MAG TPA: enoyl-CoA hydratase/isomerase family protein [Ilumatobacter sp.]|nr:enoyl-CoA hydratase/isomerase family protein [Ilumatobacter sp.]